MSGVNVEQIYTPELADYLQRNMTLVFSGESRQSGIKIGRSTKPFLIKTVTLLMDYQRLETVLCPDLRR